MNTIAAPIIAGTAFMLLVLVSTPRISVADQQPLASTLDSELASEIEFEVETSGQIAGRPVLYGYVIDATGRILRYDHSGIAGARGSGQTEEGCGEQFCTRELLEKYRLRAKVVGQVQLADLQRQIPVILPASWGRLQPAPASSTPQLTRRYLAYMHDPGKDAYRLVRLREDAGVGRIRQSNAAAAGQLADWIERSVNPDARDRDTAELNGLPIDALAVGCSGGIVGGGWSVRVARDGTVERRRWPSSLDRHGVEADHVSAATAERLLDEAQRLGIVRPLPTLSGDVSCSIQASVGAFTPTVEWFPEENGPADLRSLFKEVNDLGAGGAQKNEAVSP